MLDFDVVALDPKYNLSAYQDYAGRAIRGVEDVADSVYREIDHPLYNVDQFALEPIMFCHFMTRTRGADGAAPERLSYLPIFLGLISLLKSDETEKSLFNEAIDLIMSIAAKHPRRRFVLPLSRIYRAFSIWPWQIRFPDNVIILSIERYLPNRNVICVPYPANFVYKDAAEVDRQLAGKRDAEKTRTACFFGRPRREDHMRSGMIGLLERSAHTECVSRFAAAGRLHLLSDDTVAALADLRRRTWISIEPPGDSPSRKGIFDALLGLSLPLLFESGRYDYPFSRIFPWEDICVFINAQDEWRLLNGRKSIDSILSELAETDILARLSVLANHARLLQYTPPRFRSPTTRDAFFAMEGEIQALITQQNRSAGAAGDHS
jgi:hypothetical protein